MNEEISVWTIETWVNSFTDKYPSSNKQVLEFIYRTTERSPEVLSDFFSNGFCYYFAVMLKMNFGGNIKWLKYRSHIVWQDNNGICYDVWGVFDDYDDQELLPIEILGNCLELFTHKGEPWTEEKLSEEKAKLESRIILYEKRRKE